MSCVFLETTANKEEIKAERPRCIDAKGGNDSSSFSSSLEDILEFSNKQLASCWESCSKRWPQLGWHNIFFVAPKPKKHSSHGFFRLPRRCSQSCRFLSLMLDPKWIYLDPPKVSLLYCIWEILRSGLVLCVWYFEIGFIDIIEKCWVFLNRELKTTKVSCFSTVPHPKLLWLLNVLDWYVLDLSRFVLLYILFSWTPILVELKVIFPVAISFWQLNRDPRA